MNGVQQQQRNMHATCMLGTDRVRLSTGTPATTKTRSTPAVARRRTGTSAVPSLSKWFMCVTMLQAEYPKPTIEHDVCAANQLLLLHRASSRGPPAARPPLLPMPMCLHAPRAT